MRESADTPGLTGDVRRVTADKKEVERNVPNESIIRKRYNSIPIGFLSNRILPHLLPRADDGGNQFFSPDLGVSSERGKCEEPNRRLFSAVLSNWCKIIRIHVERGGDTCVIGYFHLATTAHFMVTNNHTQGQVLSVLFRVPRSFLRFIIKNCHTRDIAYTVLRSADSGCCNVNCRNKIYG